MSQDNEGKNESENQSSEFTERIIPINIEDEMRGAYIDYSMSVIISRALPDVRDGLKPVHRRILFAMQELGLVYNKPYKKSARIVGEVLGKYHPHGDSAVYDTMVRMAQEWSLRYTLVDGQGNFGSMDGDNPAAMRYTEARLKRISDEMLNDINKNTVDFQPNFDDSLEEPSVLPAKVPNLLVNGTSGIAVGMATNMAPHNLSEVVDGITAYIDNRDITISELMQYIKAPDFPTGGIIYGYEGVRDAYETGKGRVVMRAKANIETLKNGREQIVVTEVPYLTNKATLVERTNQLMVEKKLEGISEVREESDREGVRVVFELKKDAISNVVLNNLFKQTSLQSSFSINNVALVNGKPMTLNLKDLIRHFVDHRHDVVVRRTQFELDEAEKRAHILQGYLIALDHLDEVIQLIRNSADPESAKVGLIARFGLSEIQAKAILDMRLQRLTGLERDKIVKEYEEVMKQIERLKEILGDESIRMSIIKTELKELKDRFGDERRSIIEFNSDEFTAEDMIPDDEMVVTVSHEGYIKRTPLSEFKSQGRGGVGSKATATKDDDFTAHLFIATMHNYLLVFTEFGKVFWIKIWKLPEGTKTSKGRAIQNLIQIDPNDKVRTFIPIKTLTDDAYIQSHYLIMCTLHGTIKKTLLADYSRPRSIGITAININEGDKLLNVSLTNGSNHIIIAVDSGRAVHFHETDVRPMGRSATGVRGITLEEGSTVIGMVCVSDEQTTLLVVSEKGYGKRTGIEDYPVYKRGGKGVKTLKITDKTGKLVAITEVSDQDDLMIINKSGISLRTPVSEIRVLGRNTQGVKLIRLNNEDEIASVTRVKIIESDQPEISEEINNEN